MGIIIERRTKQIIPVSSNSSAHAVRNTTPNARTLASEPIQTGQPVRMTSGGLALASSVEGRYRCIGIALQNADIGQQCLYASDGTVTRANWQDIIGRIELSVGEQYVLGAIAGTLTTILPVANAAIMRIGVAVSINTLDIQLGELIVLADI